MANLERDLHFISSSKFQNTFYYLQEEKHSQQESIDVEKIAEINIICIIQQIKIKVRNKEY